MKQWLKEFSHNCIIHPAMMFMPKSWSHKLHDIHGKWTYNIKD